MGLPALGVWYGDILVSSMPFARYSFSLDNDFLDVSKHAKFS